MRLQTILLPDNEICDVEELYFHRRGDRIDVDGYFNLFQIEKRKRYTTLSKLTLRIELEGYRSITLMNGKHKIVTSSLDEKERQSYAFEFPYTESEGVFWFSLKEGDSSRKYIKGYFDGTAENYRKINIVADICTYKREEFVCRNMRSLQKYIFENRELDVRDHLKIYIVDNGKSLSENTDFLEICKELSGKIKVFPNKNAGGVGGFTRGMIEALSAKQEEEFTHILLMDDDAIINPDSFVRVYGLLSTLRDTYKDMIVGGSMLMEEFPYIQQAGGEWFRHFDVQAIDRRLDLRDYDNCTSPNQCSTANEDKLYSGWWYCCYSLNMVKEDNLPLPLFIHYEDVEYGMRNVANKIVFLNGVNVWHRGMDVTLPGANIYYDVRNKLIASAIHNGSEFRYDSYRFILRMSIVAMLRLKFRDIGLIVRGVRDFCRGPSWLLSQDPEKLNTSIRNQMYHTYPLDHYKQKLTEQEYVKVEKQLSEYDMKKEMIQTLRYDKSMKKRLRFIFTFNGWIFPSDSSGIKIISSLDSPYSIYRKRKIYMFEPISKKGLILTKSYRDLVKAVSKTIKMLLYMHKYIGKAACEYKTTLPLSSNMVFWSNYLR